MWAARPHLGSIFEKLLHRKTFCSPAAFSLQPRLFYFNAVFHVKHSEIAPRETTRNRFGKAGAHPQLALGIAIAPETLYLITTFRLERQLRFFRFSLRFLLHFHCAVRFASQMWAARPCLGSIFEKLLHRKTFCLPAAWILQPISILLLCHVMFHVKQMLLHCLQHCQQQQTRSAEPAIIPFLPTM